MSGRPGARNRPERLPLADRIIAACFTLGWALVRRVPERLAAWFFRTLADLLWRRRGTSVRRLEANLARVVGKDPADPAVRELSRAGMRSYFRYWMEMFRLPAMSPERIRAGTRIIGVEAIFETLASGRGVVVALPHTGNYDLAGAWLVHMGHPFTTVAERLRPESLFERFVAYRESLGMEVLPLTNRDGGSARAFATLARRLREGRPVCLPAERDLTDSGVEVVFFGAKTRMAPGPAALAVQTGAALLPAVLWFEGDGWGGRVYDEIPVPAEGTRKEKIAIMTQRMAEAFEQGIAEHPEDWHMLQRVWLDDFEPTRGGVP
ncbi:lipid A biosynthesis lauroyl acyltransferase [Thermobispora bispora]|uniref:phosphatidylinositol mannoside acyltransferase n=1 Tax=Thermobispora bispora TaxID=2006 RepID=UPI001981255F|nr:phosphatidylinositol mannoside acyltransferase [Thermobispora bispora]MBO2473369.1 phosphatidylinositol mannoside acyltransferase [Actinomycetales bacterium]MBX6167584.1 phosphatidylinositol mannoside acyltransferase [Thermobispora bispora]QSI48553.1 phosphatidylinositol mannoside acyltransferase [Thermobispora bispora]